MQGKKTYGLLLSGIGLLFFNIAAKITGFLRETVMAYYYGAGVVTDAYATAILIITTLFFGITGAIVIALIPMCSKSKSLQASNSLINNVLNFFCFFVFVTSVLAMFCAGPITRLFGMGFAPDTFHTAVMMTRLLLPFSVFFAIKDVLGALLQSMNIFWFIGVSLLISNILIIISIPLSVGGLWVLPIGYGMAWFAVALFTAILAYRKGYRYQIELDFANPNFRQAFSTAIPVFLSIITPHIHEIVDRNFASFMGVGIISAANYATKLNMLFATLIIGSVATVLFPTLSRQSVGKDLSEFRKTSAAAYSFVGFVMLPITAWLAVFSRELVMAVFQRGAFDEVATIMTSTLLIGYIIGLPFLGLNQIINYQFYALGDTRTPVACSMVSVGVNITMTAVLALTIGYIGIAIGTSIGNIFLTILLLIRLNKRGGILDAGAILRPLIKSFASSGAMVAAMISAKVLLKPMIDNGFAFLFSCTLIGGIVYLVVGTMLKAEEIKFTKDHLRNFLRGGGWK